MNQMDNKSDNYIKKLIKIALPMTIQNLIVSSINMADVFMIGGLGSLSLAAVGLANQITFLFILLMFGINNTASIFISQFFGNNETDNVKRVAGLAGVMCVAVSILVSILALVIPETLIGFYSKDPEILSIAIPYVKIVAPTYIFTALSIVLSVTLKSTSRTNVPLYGSIAALITNVTLNYILIFGHFGFKAYGVRGAAIATVIARIVELLVLYFISLLKKYDIFPTLNLIKSIQKIFIKTFTKMLVPILGSHIIWALGTTGLTAVYAKMGTSALSAMQIAGAISGITYTLTMGVGSAIGIIVGQELGKRNFDYSVFLAKKLTTIIFYLGIALGVVLFFLVKPIIGLYNIDEEAKIQAIKALQYLCIIIPFSGVNFTNLTGTLRAGGDTSFLFILDTVSMWIVGIPIAILSKNLGFTVSSVFFISTGFENLVKFIVGTHRVLKLNWVKSFTKE